MSVSPAAVLKLVLPHVPHLTKTALLNALSRSPNSDLQDLKTELFVNLFRSFLGGNAISLAKQQKLSCRDPGVEGGMWVSRVVMSADGEEEKEGIKKAVHEAMKEMAVGSGEVEANLVMPEVESIEAEWTGYRAGMKAKDKPYQGSEEEKYKKMMGEVESDVTVLYLHGGAYFLCDLASHRHIVTKYAEMTKGRCLSVKYRLAPQAPFPSPVIDALLAYLYLLSPPPGSLHEPVPASKIIIAGDSAGGGLSLALNGLLLSLHRLGIKSLRFHGKGVAIDLPAGVALCSPWGDLTRSLPSIYSKAKYDYLREPRSRRPNKYVPIATKTDSIWPAKPPRLDIYVPDCAMLTNGLASPACTPTAKWANSPPLFISVGNEGLEDDSRVIAKKAFDAGVHVTFEGSEGMPHVFGMMKPLFPTHPMCVRYLDSITTFMTDAVNGKIVSSPLPTEGKWIKAFTYKEESFPLSTGLMYADLPTTEDAERIIAEERDWLMEAEKEIRASWKGASSEEEKKEIEEETADVATDEMGGVVAAGDAGDVAPALEGKARL